MQDDEQDTSDPKRNRAAEWPLKTAEEQKRNMFKSEKSSKKPISPRSKREATLDKRPSKFFEGSMNDRVSNRPPSLYTREDDSMEHYGSHSQKSGPTHRVLDMDGGDTFNDAGIETNKPSGMYRFGRAIVNAFKPVAVWRGFNATRDERERQTHLEKSIMEERRDKAEKAYAELKKNNFKGLQTSLNNGRDMESPAINVTHKVQSVSHRDSGIDMNEFRPLAAQLQDDQESRAKAQLMPLPQVTDIGRSKSSVPEAIAVRISSMQFRKPSFQNLKKAKSHIQLPSAKRHTTLAAWDPSIKLEDAAGTVALDQSLRKQPSRKDIAKQQKLSKRVSDLESQLEIARRNLKLSMNDPEACSEMVSHKRSKPFKPGALPSLPSESILNAQNSGSKANTRSSLATFSERQVKIKSEDNDLDNVAIDPAMQVDGESKKSIDWCTVSRKRKSGFGDEGTCYGPNTNTDHEKESDTAEATRPRRKSKPSLKAIENEKYNMDISKTVIGNKQQKSIPQKSRLNEAEPVPPLPATLTSFDPANIDQAKFISMRSPCNMKTPFGKDSDDLINLRKEFPTIADTHLADYLASLNEDDKRTDHTSLSHHNQPVTPLLPPPRCTSPIKAEPLKHAKDQTLNMQSSQYPSKLSIAPMTSADSMGSKGSQKINLSKTQPLSPTLLRASESKKVRSEKPLPEIQKEDYDWPDDVF